MAGPDGAKPRRHLPLVKEPEEAQEGDAERPPWHWSAIGAVGVFVLWLPLAMLVNGPLAGSLRAEVTENAPPGVLLVALNILAFGVAALISGLLIGRFGALAGPKQAAVSGASAAAVAWGIAVAGAPPGTIVVLLFALAVLVVVGGGGGYLGGRWGVRLR